MFDLKDKAAIVTGSSLGIGSAAALYLARCGADVAVNYRKHDAEAKALIKTYKQRERATRSLLRAFKRMTFGRIASAQWDLWQHLTDVHGHLAQLHRLARKESLIKGWYEWRLKVRFKQSERRIQKMNEQLSRLVRRLQDDGHIEIMTCCATIMDWQMRT